MALNLKLQMRLSQQLIMTPQLQQAIKLLQLSRQELEELIDQALIENPVLEEAEEAAEPTEEGEALDAALPSETDVIENEQHPEKDRDWDEYIASGSGVIPERASGGSDGEEPSLEATLSRSDTLHDHVRWQLEMSSLSTLEQRVGRTIIGNLDDDGYLTASVQEMLEFDPDLHAAILKGLKAGEFTLAPVGTVDPEWLQAKHEAVQADTGAPRKGRKAKAPPDFEAEEAEQAAEATPPPPKVRVKPEAAEALERVLRYLQLCDPLGVGARNLQECLEIQLRQLGLEESLPFRIVHNDLKLLENKDLRKVARRQKVEVEEVVEAYKLIMTLEPKPGRPFERDRTQSIIPDVYIYKVHGEPASNSEDRVGQYRVVLNDSGLPRLRINDYYRDLADSMGSDGSLTQEYVQEKIKAGNWLMKSIEQRQKTILRVTKSILKHQYEFFEHGISYLKPLVLKDVAEDIEVHESTVSRITTNKYVHTPQGLFELKYFFTSGIDQGQGEVISSKKIKDMIHRIISSEDAREPLTDIQIAEHLSKASNVKVARRTVAKYREALNLLPSNKRKKMF